MTIAPQLLAQVRRATTTVQAGISDPAHKALLDALDTCASALQLHGSNAFNLDHIESGRGLLADGALLAAKHGVHIDPNFPSDLSASTDSTVLQQHLRDLNARLVSIVEALDENRSAEEKAYLERLSDWESAFYKKFLDNASSPVPEVAEGITQASLQSYLQQRFPDWKNLRVTKLMPLVGGFSKKTILFATEDDVSGNQEMVIRAEQPVDLLRYEGSDVTKEYALIRYLRAAGLPLAEPLWLEADRERLGTRFIVSRRAIGKTYGGNLGSDETISPALLQSMLGTFVQLHKLEPDPDNADISASHLAEWLPHRGSLQDTTRYMATQFMPGLVRKTGIPMSPQLARGLKWLANNVPESDERPVILHIDFALNNLIIDGERITAVLDWESSRLGDPAEDIIWTQQNLAAFIDLAQFLDFYRRETGRTITPFRIAYAKLTKCVLNAIACLSSLHALEAFPDTHINASILAYKYLALFGSQFNALIAEAEQAR